MTAWESVATTEGTVEGTVEGGVLITADGASYRPVGSWTTVWQRIPSGPPPEDSLEAQLARIDDVAAEIYDCEAREGEHFDVIVDVRPEKARRSNPYPAPCVECFADQLLDNLGSFGVPFPAGSARVCCACWSGMRAIRCAFHMRCRGWDAWWWAMSPACRTTFP